MGCAAFSLGAGAVVLTIGKLGATRGRLEYYDSRVAAGVEDYYAGRGESPGRWRGSGIEALGLTQSGRVERSEFMALMRGCSPVDGSVLRLMSALSTVSAFDLTFSAPKSVSVLFAIDQEHVSGALLAAHERAVDAALARFAIAPADLVFHGEPYSHDSRAVLKRQLTAAADLGYTFNVGVEPEVYVLRELDGEWRPWVNQDLYNVPTRGPLINGIDSSEPAA